MFIENKKRKTEISYSKKYWHTCDSNIKFAVTRFCLHCKDTDVNRLCLYNSLLLIYAVSLDLRSVEKAWLLRKANCLRSYQIVFLRKRGESYRKIGKTL